MIWWNCGIKIIDKLSKTCRTWYWNYSSFLVTLYQARVYPLGKIQTQRVHNSVHLTSHNSKMCFHKFFTIFPKIKLCSQPAIFPANNAFPSVDFQTWRFALQNSLHEIFDINFITLPHWQVWKVLQFLNEITKWLICNVLTCNRILYLYHNICTFYRMMPL